MSEALEIGKKLVELCNSGKSQEVLETYYADDIISVEAMPGTPEMPQTLQGIDAINAKHEWWYANHEIHSSSAEGPYPHGDRFIVNFTMDITPTAGPMSGQRMKSTEAALYTVKDGKIIKEEFFYAM